MSEAVLHTGYWCAGVGGWQVSSALLPLPSAAAHTDWPRAEAPRRRPQLVLSLAPFPTAEALWEAKNSKLFTNARKKCVICSYAELCRMANWSPICFADKPTSNEYRRWVVLNDDCRMCCSIDYRMIANSIGLYQDGRAPVTWLSFWPRRGRPYRRDIRRT